MRRIFWMGVGALGALWLARRLAGGRLLVASAAVGSVSGAVRQFRSSVARREAELVELLVEPAGGTWEERRNRGEPGAGR